MVCLDAAEDVDDLAVARSTLGVDDVAQRVRLNGADHGPARGQGLRLGVDDRLELDVARVRLAHDILGDSPLEQAYAAGFDALEGHGGRGQAVPQTSKITRHGSGACECAGCQWAADGGRQTAGDGRSWLRS